MKKDLPSRMWISIVALSAITLVQLAMALGRDPSGLAWAALGIQAFLVLGLYRLWKLAYVLVLVTCLVGIVRSGSKDLRIALGVALVDALVAVPMLMSTREFFPRGSSTARKQAA